MVIHICDRCGKREEFTSQSSSIDFYDGHIDTCRSCLDSVDAYRKELRKRTREVIDKKVEEFIKQGLSQDKSRT